MGTFVGHALPGAFFMLFSLWWTSQIPRRYILCQRRKVPFFNTATYPLPVKCCKNWPTEGIIKIVMTLVGMALEIFASTDYGKEKTVVYLGDIQHCTMYSFFCLSGIVDVLRGRNALFAPPGLDYLIAALAFAAEWILFSNHLGGRPPLDVTIHTFLLYVIAATVIVVLLEYKYPQSLMLGLCRCALVLLQGTWFIQVGFILYPPSPVFHSWDPHDHENMMFATMMFAWHFGACVIVVLVAFLGLCMLYEKSCATFELEIEDIPWSRNTNRQTDSCETDDEDDETDEQINGGRSQYKHTMLANGNVSSDEETFFDGNTSDRRPLIN